MEEAMAARYWCHMCSQMVNPIMEAEIKCLFCQSGFVEKMSGNNGNTLRNVQYRDTGFGTDNAMSLWASILLGMMSSPRSHRRFRGVEFAEENDDDDDEVNPDDKQRSELSRRLCLDTRQVKFLFQNRRTHMNVVLHHHLRSSPNI